MGWATFHIEKLKKGETVQFSPRGNSMVGKIDSGDLCTVVPAKPEELEVGSIVLCKVGGAHRHLISRSLRMTAFVREVERAVPSPLSGRIR